mgnify:CR=1 FL=1
MTRWFVVSGVLLVFAGIAAGDWLDGASGHPDSALIYALLVLAGAALGWRPPWSRGND